MVFITHDLALASTLREGRIAVMYLGRVVEIGPTVDDRNLAHPYTAISAIPEADPEAQQGVDGAAQRVHRA